MTPPASTRNGLKEMSEGKKKITRNLSQINGHEFEQTLGDSEG